MTIAFIEKSCIIFAVSAVFGAFALSKGKGKKNKVLIGLLSFLAIGILFAETYARFIEPNWIEVTHISIKNNSFSPELANLKIVQLSDLHTERVAGFREERLVTIVNNLAPDIILFTGDFVNSEEGLAPSIKVLKKLKTKYGIYAILGNTDYFFFYNENTLINDLKEAGVTVLLHDSRKIDMGERGVLWLAGLSYNYNGAENVDRAFAGIPIREPKIFLMHVPEAADTPGIADYSPQLMLAGHTHGGQFGIPFLRKHSAYAERSKYMSGLFNVNGIPLYVNRGIGMKTRNVRFFCRPEITVFRLEKQ